MDTKTNEGKNYRPNVAAVIVSSSYPQKCEVFVAERSDIEGAWQFPQGGVDQDEAPREALLRELKEEIGTADVEIIAEYPGWISYDFPVTVAKKMYPYDGQKQRYFLVRLKEGATITLDTKVPEFSQYRFVEVSKIIDVVSHFKRAIYKRVLNHFRKTGYL
jgi:putative (di)nucleoside polyphosphate hydrolase